MSKNRLWGSHGEIVYDSYSGMVSEGWEYDGVHIIKVNVDRLHREYRNGIPESLDILYAGFFYVDVPVQDGLIIQYQRPELSPAVEKTSILAELELRFPELLGDDPLNGADAVDRLAAWRQDLLS